MYKGAPHGLYTTHKEERERRPGRVFEGLRLNDWHGIVADGDVDIFELSKGDVMNRSIEVTQELERRQEAALITPTDLKAEATRDISAALNAILADVFALYLKTKNFHWHMSGPHFRDYHLLLDEQGDQLFAMTDPIAERVRKLGGTTVRSIGHIARLQRVADNDALYVEPEDMLAELREESKTLAARLREAHGVCEEYEDIATASLIEVWIDETERRTWFLFEAGRRSDSTGH